MAKVIMAGDVSPDNYDCMAEGVETAVVLQCSREEAAIFAKLLYREFRVGEVHADDETVVGLRIEVG